MNKQTQNSIQLLLLAALCYFIIFHKMGAHPLRVWDESYFAVHTYEMLEQGSMIVSYFDGQPDVRGSKPPIQNWSQMLFTKLIGYNVVSMRLPSAIAAALTVFLTFFFVRRESNTLHAWMAALILLTSVGFITFHTARTGDADAMLTLALMLQFFSVYYLFKSDLQSKWIWAFFGSLVFAFYVKAYAAAFYLPGFLLYGLLFERPRFFRLFTRWQSYAGLLGMVAIIGAYFYIRETLQPGYIDYGLRGHAGRIATAIGTHGHPWDLYMLKLTREHFHWWIALSGLGLVLAFHKRSKNSLLSRLAALTVLAFLALISASKTKLVWYDAPAFPLLAMVSAIPLVMLFEAFDLDARWVAVLVAALFVLPIIDMVRKSQANYPGLAERKHEIKEYYLHKLFSKGIDPDGLTVLVDSWPGALMFYQYAFQDRGQTIHRQDHINDLRPGQRVLVSGEELKEQLAQRYEADTLEHMHNALVLHINKIK